MDKATGWCRGCWRTRAEIEGWKKLSGKARGQVQEAVALRRSGGAGDPGIGGSPASAPAPVAPAAGRRVRHRKSGRVYTELYRGAMKADGTAVVVYRGDDGRVWVRPASQFDDGRFEPAAP